jgi:hypothetical protein
MIIALLLQALCSQARWVWPRSGEPSEKELQIDAHTTHGDPQLIQETTVKVNLQLSCVYMKNSVDLSFTTNPKPKGQLPHCLLM